MCEWFFLLLAYFSITKSTSQPIQLSAIYLYLIVFHNGFHLFCFISPYIVHVLYSQQKILVITDRTKLNALFSFYVILTGFMACHFFFCSWFFFQSCSNRPTIFNSIRRQRVNVPTFLLPIKFQLIHPKMLITAVVIMNVAGLDVTIIVFRLYMKHYIEEFQLI